MNYPEDFLKQRSGPSPKGRGDKRALDGIDSPYLTIRDGTTTTRKKGEFTETRSTPGAPSLYGYTAFAAGGNTFYAGASVDFVDGRTVPRVTTKVAYRLGSNSPTLPRARTPYAGDGFLLTMYGNGNDAPSANALHWPLLLRPTPAIKEYKASDPEKANKTTTFIDQIQIGGLGAPAHYFTMLGSGWDGAEKRYRFCLAATYYADENDKFRTRAPAFYTGDTGTQSMQQVSFPFFPGRDNPFCSPYVIGPGKLQALQVAVEDLDKPLLAPFFATSNDHGSTWSTTTASFLTPHLFMTPARAANPAATPPEPAVRAGYDNDQLAGIGAFGINVYLGEGKHILIVPNGFVDMGGANSSPRFAAMAFLGTNGSGYTRLAWPADVWYVSSSGHPLQAGGNRIRLVSFSQDARSAQRGFGLGCMYIGVDEGTTSKLMVTHDFGQTWTLASPTGAPNGFADAGAVIRPYKSPEKPGQLVFASAKYATVADNGRIEFLSIDGTFTKFKKTIGIITSKTRNITQTVPGTEAVPNLYFTNFGGDKPAYIFPAFPGEFEKP